MLRVILFGTGTNYLKIVARLVTGLVTFRLLYQRLGPADFGLFQLLWMSFGYMLLLDFGFGVSVQRAIARNDGSPAAARERSEVVSTVFWGYVAMSLVVAVVVAVGGEPLLRSFGFSGEGGLRADQRAASVIFAAGTIIGFPFGIYREAMRGQNRLHVANLIDLAFVGAHLAGIGWGCTHGWGLPVLMLISVATASVPPMVMAAVAMRDPAMRPRLSAFRRARLRELGGFSIYAYGITATNMLIMQADQFVIGWLIAIEALKSFLPGLKLASMYFSLAGQMQDTLGPVAARLDALSDDRAAGLRRLMATSQRWALMVATPMAFPLAFDFTSALHLITGESAPTSPMRWTAAWLVAATWLSVLSSSCTKRILVMIGHHRALLGLSALEAVVSLAVGAWLAWTTHNVAGVAFGKFAASVVALLLVPAFACRALGLPKREFIRASARGVLAGWPAALVAAAWWSSRPLANPSALFLCGCAAVAIAMPFGWWWGGMVPDERARVRALLARLRRRAADGAPAP